MYQGKSAMACFGCRIVKASRYLLRLICHKPVCAIAHPLIYFIKLFNSFHNFLIRVDFIPKKITKWVKICHVNTYKENYLITMYGY